MLKSQQTRVCPTKMHNLNTTCPIWILGIKKITYLELIISCWYHKNLQPKEQKVKIYNAIKVRSEEICLFALLIASIKLYKTLDYWSRDVLNFNFPEKGLGLVYSLHFVYDFWRIMFPLCILLTDQISLPDYLYLSRY